MELFDKNIMALPGARRALGFLMATALVDGLLVVGQAVALAWVLSALWAAAGTGPGAVAGQLAGSVPGIAAFAGCYLLRQAVVFARGKVMDTTAQRCTAELLQRFMGAVLASGPALVQRFGSGTVTAACVEGMDRIKSYIELSLPKSTDLMVVTTVLALAVLALDWVSGVIVFVTIPCIVMFMRLLGENSRRAAADQHGEYERLTNHFADTLRGFPTIKMFGRSAAFAQQVHARSESLREATVATLKTVTLSSLVLDLFRTFALAAVAIMLGFRLMAGDVELFRALAVLIAVPELYAAIRRYSADFHATLEGKNQLRAVVQMMAAVEEGTGEGTRAEDGAHAEADTCDAPPAQAPYLAVRNLDYTYRTGDEERLALRDVSFAVPRCCKVGIVGASGAGKSTLVRLLAGFSTLDTGSEVVVGGERFETLADPRWQRQVTYIPQEPHVFHATLRENVAFYCPGASDDEVRRAVAAVGLRPVADALPQGLETIVGQGGRSLSGGQAQRVALARALLDADRRVWLLDEPTAHLDVETELALKQNMLPLMEGRLVFFATHRLHWMRDMDLLVVLQDGRVAQVGTYDDLCAQPGAFAELVRSLQRGYGA